MEECDADFSIIFLYTTLFVNTSFTFFATMVRSAAPTLSPFPKPLLKGYEHEL
jgi:hypothetical protein